MQQLNSYLVELRGNDGVLNVMQVAAIDHQHARRIAANHTGLLVLSTELIA